MFSSQGDTYRYHALISQESHTLRETVVTENGKVIPEPTGSIDSDSVSQFYPLPRDFFVDIKQNRPLRLKRKLYEFYHHQVLCSLNSVPDIPSHVQLRGVSQNGDHSFHSRTVRHLLHSDHGL
uniref:Uncharacterized protein n=1 Tax=Cacopsylla melanoneura TaxID=428564 RepID=A0A8D8ZXP7_9HEMI